MKDIEQQLQKYQNRNLYEKSKEIVDDGLCLIFNFLYELAEKTIPRFTEYIGNKSRGI